LLHAGRKPQITGERDSARLRSERCWSQPQSVHHDGAIIHLHQALVFGESLAVWSEQHLAGADGAQQVSAIGRSVPEQIVRFPVAWHSHARLVKTS
jgi:hypothetical protein